jgi:hypothetical protein
MLHTSPVRFPYFKFKSNIFIKIPVALIYENIIWLYNPYRGPPVAFGGFQCPAVGEWVINWNTLFKNVSLFTAVCY